MYEAWYMSSRRAQSNTFRLALCELAGVRDLVGSTLCVLLTL